MPSGYFLVKAMGPSSPRVMTISSAPRSSHARALSSKNGQVEPLQVLIRGLDDAGEDTNFSARRGPHQRCG